MAKKTSTPDTSPAAATKPSGAAPPAAVRASAPPRAEAPAAAPTAISSPATSSSPAPTEPAPEAAPFIPPQLPTRPSAVPHALGERPGQNPNRAGKFLFVDLYHGDLHGKPDWAAIRDAHSPGFEYAGGIIKATEGAHYDTTWFATNWPAIKNAAPVRYGVDWFRGCYHYLIIPHFTAPEHAPAPVIEAPPPAPAPAEPPTLQPLACEEYESLDPDGFASPEDYALADDAARAQHQVGIDAAAEAHVVAHEAAVAATHAANES